MNRRLTRRSLAKLLAAAPVGLALPVPARKAEPARTYSEVEKKAIAKAAAATQKALAPLRKMAIPIGTEPAAVFSPLVAKK